MGSAVSLAIVMPVFNEEQALPVVLNDWRTRVLDRVNGSVVIAIDDGSRDASAAVLDRAAAADARVRVVHQQNAGHGAAITAGYREALRLGAEWVAQCDSDGQFTAEQFDSLWSRREGVVMVRGKRSHRTDPLHRKLGAVLERLIILVIFGRVVADPNCGFRLMHRSLVEKSLSLIGPRDVAPNFEISVVASMLERRAVRTVLVNCGPRLFGVSNFPLKSYVRAGLRVIRDVLVLRSRMLGQK